MDHQKRKSRAANKSGNGSKENGKGTGIVEPRAKKVLLENKRSGKGETRKC
jgi:hypothetical protein